MWRIGLALLLVASFISGRKIWADDAPPSVEEIRAAVASGTVLAEKAAKNYPSHRQCFACHHQTLPLLAAREAEKKDVMFDARLPASVADFTQNSFHVKLDSMKEGKGIGGS